MVLLSHTKRNNEPEGEKERESWSSAKWPLGICGSVKPQRSINNRQVVVVVVVESIQA